jgi:hypothetical protein
MRSSPSQSGRFPWSTYALQAWQRAGRRPLETRRLVTDPPNGSRPGQSAERYDEQTFGWFLAIERRRAERSSHTFHLLLVDLNQRQGVRPGIDREVAARLFEALTSCLRRTDVVGWYRQGRAVGAILVESNVHPRSSALLAILERVTEVLGRHLGPDVATHLRVRVLQHPEPHRATVTAIHDLSMTRS